MTKECHVDIVRWFWHWNVMGDDKVCEGTQSLWSCHNVMWKCDIIMWEKRHNYVYSDDKVCYNDIAMSHWHCYVSDDIAMSLWHSYVWKLCENEKNYVIFTKLCHLKINYVKKWQTLSFGTTNFVIFDLTMSFFDFAIAEWQSCNLRWRVDWFATWCWWDLDAECDWGSDQ